MIYWIAGIVAFLIVLFILTDHTGDEFGDSL